MGDKKLLDLVELLIEKTNIGSMRWEPTIDPGVFQASFPTHSIKLLRRGRGDPDDCLYVVQVFDAQGELIDEISSEELNQILSAMNEPDREYNARMDRMYALARRRAHGIESALDVLMSEIDAA